MAALSTLARAGPPPDPEPSLDPGRIEAGVGAAGGLEGEVGAESLLGEPAAASPEWTGTGSPPPSTTGARTLPASAGTPRGGLLAGAGVRLSPRLVLHGAARLGATYDTNVGRAEAGEVDDVDLNTRLTLGLTWQGEHLALELGYALTSHTYLASSELDALDHEVRFSARYDPPRRQPVRAGLRAVLASLSRAGDPRTTRGADERLLAQSELWVSWALTRRLSLRPEAAVTLEDHRSRALSSQDRLDWRADLLLGFALNRALTLEAGGGYREVLLSEAEAIGPDLVIRRLLAGARYLSRRLEVSALIGWELGHVTEARGYVGPEPSALFFRIDGRWQLRAEATFLECHALRTIDVSGAVGPQTLTACQAGLRQLLTEALQVDLAIAWERQSAYSGDRVESLRYGGGAKWTPRAWLELDMRVEHELRLSAGGFEALRISAGLTLRL